MPTNTGVKQTLRELPYREMRDLAGEIVVGLTDTDQDVTQMCEILSSLPLEESEKDKLRNIHLTGFFTRKRALTIQPRGEGWEISMAGVPITVHNMNIREGVSQFFDSLISYLVLEKA